MANFDSKDWQLYCEIARSEPYKEHTELLSVERAAQDPLFATYKFGAEQPQDAAGCTLMSFRKYGELYVTKAKKRTHELVVASSGAGKTQGCILNEAFNMDGKTSYIYTDPKGEVTACAYAYAVEKYGKENVIVANYMQPQFSNVKFNPLTKFARQRLAAEGERESVKRFIRDNVVTEITKFLEVTCVVKSAKDPTWEETARNFIFAIIMGLIEDMTISDEEAKRTKRVKTYPEQINFETVSRIFYSFSWDRSMSDNGFLTTRRHDSLAYQNSKSVINNAPNTRANYLQFVENYLRLFAEPKIRQMSDDDTFDIESMAKTPKVLFIIYDLSDVNVREWVNIIIADSLQNLLAYSHRTAKPFDVPVVFVCDEFPTLKPHKIYPTVLETGRGSNLFMVLSVQSLSQIAARYPEDHISMLENCGVRLFLGTNDVETAKRFIASMGRTTVPSATAYLSGRYSSEPVDVVTIDELMHRMKLGDSYICIDRSMPVHGSFALYDETPEYTQYPVTPNTDHAALYTSADVPEYSPSWLSSAASDDDDDDDFFDRASRLSPLQQYLKEREEREKKEKAEKAEKAQKDEKEAEEKARKYIANIFDAARQSDADKDERDTEVLGEKVAKAEKDEKNEKDKKDEKTEKAGNVTIIPHPDDDDGIIDALDAKNDRRAEFLRRLDERRDRSDAMPELRPAPRELKTAVTPIGERTDLPLFNGQSLRITNQADDHEPIDIVDSDIILPEAVTDVDDDETPKTYALVVYDATREISSGDVAMLAATARVPYMKALGMSSALPEAVHVSMTSGEVIRAHINMSHAGFKIAFLAEEYLNAAEISGEQTNDDKHVSDATVAIVRTSRELPRQKAIAIANALMLEAKMQNRNAAVHIYASAADRFEKMTDLQYVKFRIKVHSGDGE